MAEWPDEMPPKHQAHNEAWKKLVEAIRDDDRELIAILMKILEM